MFLQNLPPLSRGLIIAFVVSTLLAMLAPTIAFSVLPLYPETVLHGFQLWRLVSYPFFVIAGGLFNAIFQIVWIGMMIVFFGGELEAIVHTKRLAFALLGSVLLGGVVYMFLAPDSVLAGPQIITMFFLTGFAYLWPKREVSIFGIFFVKVWIIALVYFLFSILPSHRFTIDMSAANLFAPVFGALAALVFFHVTYLQYSFGRSLIASMTPIPRKREPAFDANDPRAVQRRIDTILDKISQNGVESLSKEERDFLLKHSGA